MPFALIGIIMLAAIWNIRFDINMITIGAKVIVGALIYLALSLAYIIRFHREILDSIIPRKKVVK